MLITNPGHILIFTGFLLNLLNILLSICKKEYSTTYLITQISQYLVIICSFGCLIYNFLLVDLHYVAVALNSSSIMPIIYRISGSWSSHETSMVFFLFTNAIVFLVFSLATSFKYRVVNFTNNIITILTNLYIICFSNPFMRVAVGAKEGLGMNASLQDHAMLIHPPILFFAYSFLQLQYSMNIARLLKKNNIPNNLQQFISKISFALITTSIALGGWWAYRELGWGGYWFFDPVENLSLITWICALIYHHNLLSDKESDFTALLGLLPVISIYLGTYLIRSNLLNSVHSFAYSNGTLMILFIGICLCAPVMFFAKIINLSNKNKYILLSTYLWAAAILIIIVSIIAPIISKEIQEIKPSFFHYTLVPIMLIASLLSGLSTLQENNRLVTIFIISHLLIIPAAIFILKSGYITSFAYFVGVLIINSTIYGSCICNKGKIWRQKWSQRSGMILGHSSVGLFIIAVAFNNNFVISENITISQGQQKTFGDKATIVLDSIEYSNGPNFLNQRLVISLTEQSNILKLMPELRYYPVEEALSSEVSIVSRGVSDWYCLINNIEKDTVSIQLMYQRGVRLIWFSTILCIISILLRPVKLF